MREKKMSTDNIKELFSKRAAESENFNISTGNPAPGNAGKGEESSKYDKNIFESLAEHEAGITEYMNPCGGFSGVLKERFSDFQVHEIDLDGNLVRLTSFDLPVTPQRSDEEPNHLLEDSVWEDLKKLKEKKVTCVEIDVSNCDKEKRGEIHKIIKKKFQKMFTSNTVTSGDNGEKKLIVVTLGKDTRNFWPSEYGNYLHFVLYKSNIDTMDAINVIACKLGANASNITYAGTKDKRAKTSQQVCMWHMKPERLVSLNNCLLNIRLGNFSYSDKQIKLGDLKGNHFKIALRNVTASDEIINNAFNSLKENGFINYFGLQRFGNSRQVPTFKIGKALLKGDFKGAVELILKPREGKICRDGLEEAKKVWWKTRDAKKACDCLRSKNRTLEAKLLSGLKMHGSNAYVNALDSIPRNARLLYLHSYQSLLWNKIVSRRIKEFGPTVLEGDLIVNNKNETHDKSDIIDDTLKSTSDTKVQLKCVTAEEVGNYKIFDIVHPLPGYSIIYPNNIIKTWYEDLLKEEELTTEEFKQKVREYSLSGTYRNIVKKVKDLSWEIVFYSNPEDSLILSDLDVIKNDVLNLESKETAEFKAVIMNFSLDSSTYATMAIREVLKINISSSYQALLNNYSNKRRGQDQEQVDEGDKKKAKTYFYPSDH